MSEFCTWIIGIVTVIVITSFWPKLLERISRKIDRKIGFPVFTESIKYATISMVIFALLTILTGTGSKRS